MTLISKLISKAEDFSVWIGRFNVHILCFCKVKTWNFTDKLFRDMRQRNITCFAVLIATLVLLQDTYAELSVNFDENASKRRKMETGWKDLVEIYISKAREKS